jgi:hypothetical protein
VSNLKQKDYIQLTGIIFAVVAVIHAWRLLAGWGVVVGNYLIPYWFSIVGLLVAGYLFYTSQKLKK